MLNFKNHKVFVLLFLLPALFLYICLEVYPVFQGVVLSFYRWKGISGSQFKFYGLNNYLEVFQDRVFWLSMHNLFSFLVIGLTTILPIGFILAFVLSHNLRGTKFFRVTFFLPVVISITAISLMWKMILAGNYGLLNSMLEAIHLSGLARPWLTDPKVSFNSIALINSWIQVGYYMVILLAGILSIPEELFESLKLDGAGAFTTIFKFIIPLIWDVIGTCAILIITQVMKTFDLIYVLTSGSFGPADVNQVPIGLMYYNSFIRDNFGQGSAISTLVMFLGVLLAASIYLNVFQKKTIG
jgi:raffinose/stachyose/melibiose transport system permease protein